MDFGIAGKKALVCGASKGLGFACAEALYSEGADLMLIGRDEKALDSACRKIAENAKSKSEASTNQGKLSFSKCDLLSKEARAKLAENLKSSWGSPLIVVHNVGGPKASHVQDTSAESWQEGFERLFLPVVDLNAFFLPQMKESGWGRIVTVTSLSVVEPIAMLSVSNALRSASTAMSKTLSDEVAKFGITVNCVAPGLILTDRTEDLIAARLASSGQSRAEYEAEVLKSIPAGRLGRPDEYGAVVCFLCSQQASYINGSTVYVDGGKRRSTY